MIGQGSFPDACDASFAQSSVCMHYRCGRPCPFSIRYSGEAYETSAAADLRKESSQTLGPPIHISRLHDAPCPVGEGWAPAGCNRCFSCLPGTRSFCPDHELRRLRKSLRRCAYQPGSIGHADRRRRDGRSRCRWRLGRPKWSTQGGIDRRGTCSAGQPWQHSGWLARFVRSCISPLPERTITSHTPPLDAGRSQLSARTPRFQQTRALKANGTACPIKTQQLRLCHVFISVFETGLHCRSNSASPASAPTHKIAPRETCKSGQ